MKAADIFDSVMGLMFSEQTEKADYAGMFFPILNIILAECFWENNVLRQKRGAEALEKIPLITKEEQEIAYEEQILRTIVPYGVAANLYAEDDENGITNVYREKYMLLKAEIGEAHFEEAEEEW